MKTTIKFIIAGIPMIAISMFLTNCKSGEETKTEQTTVEETETEETKADADTAMVEVTADTAATKATRKPLTVILQNLESATAPIYVSVYGVKSKFPSPKGQLKEYKFTPNGKEYRAEIADLKFGTYALATYQDENSSGEIDKNLIGMPTEGFGFSNNYKPKVKAPAFKDCKFAYDETNNTVTVNMIR